MYDFLVIFLSLPIFKMFINLILSLTLNFHGDTDARWYIILSFHCTNISVTKEEDMRQGELLVFSTTLLSLCRDLDADQIETGGWHANT